MFHRKRKKLVERSGNTGKMCVRRVRVRAGGGSGVCGGGGVGGGGEGW